MPPFRTAASRSATANAFATACRAVRADDNRPDVRDLFSRNKKAREIDRALTALVDAGRLQRHKGHDGNGRPAELWVPAPQAA